MRLAPRLLCFTNFFSAQPFPVPSSLLPRKPPIRCPEMRAPPAACSCTLSIAPLSAALSRVEKKVFMTLNLQERGFQNPYGGLTWTCGRGTWLGLYSTSTGGDGVFLSAAGHATGPVLTTVSPLQVSRTRPYGQPAFRT